ncbi:hypothetical protein CGRA01v4_02791 [Colletotrichum graminicola]|nr:hypothetical protein CGRA01v4_02791 [Colletotrichum graminicola]
MLRDTMNLRLFSACFVRPISLLCFWQSALEYGSRKEGIMVSIYDGAGRTLFFFFVPAIPPANNPGRERAARQQSTQDINVFEMLLC